MSKQNHDGWHLRLAIALEEAEIYSKDRRFKTQEEAGKILGVTKSALGKMLQGQRLPSREVEQRICEVTGVFSGWLMNNKGPKRMEDIIDLSNFNEDDKAMLKSLGSKLGGKE